jgi:hypothetical protein
MVNKWTYFITHRPEDSLSDSPSDSVAYRQNSPHFESAAAVKRKDVGHSQSGYVES